MKNKITAGYMDANLCTLFARLFNSGNDVCCVFYDDLTIKRKNKVISLEFVNLYLEGQDIAFFDDGEGIS